MSQRVVAMFFVVWSTIVWTHQARGDQLASVLAEAEQGDGSAQVKLGAMYEQGRGVPKSQSEAVRWYQRAAEQGHAEGQYNLGWMYAEGWGIRRDGVYAYAWWNIAAGKGHDKAKENRDALRMSTAQLAEAQQLSVRLAKSIQDQQTRKAASALSSASAVNPSNGAGAPPTARLTPSPIPPRGLVTRVQTLLDLLGYHPGPVDGLMGPKTTDAVKAFQKEIELTPTGYISEELLVLLQGFALALTERSEKEASPQPASSGSGFMVSADGYAVTNEHVVAECTSVSAKVGEDDKSVKITATDKTNDLALLKLSDGETGVANFRQSNLLRLGEKVVVVGYPLSGMLSTGLKVTAGTATALAGPSDDARLLQISAPVQQGNSGGPLLDESGNVIGVVTSKLNSVWAASALGDIPQNVNFALKGFVARGFLDTHGVKYTTADSSVPVDTPSIAEAAKSFTIEVECWK